MKSNRNKNSPAAQHLRIIAGQWRGRRLPIPGVEGLRPTGDRLRETLFNWLMPDLPGARCLDLFAGSGALGFEALSRGAGSAVLVERDRQAAAQLRKNCATLGARNVQIVEDDALHWLNRDTDEGFDIVFLDPPFAKDLWEHTTTALAQHQRLNPFARIYLETPKGFTLQPPPNWQLDRHKDAGAVSAWLFTHQSNQTTQTNGDPKR